MADSPAPNTKFTDLEIRIFQRQDQGYPVEITLGCQQEFSRGYLPAEIVPWSSEGSEAAGG